MDISKNCHLSLAVLSLISHFVGFPPFSKRLLSTMIFTLMEENYGLQKSLNQNGRSISSDVSRVSY